MVGKLLQSLVDGSELTEKFYSLFENKSKFTAEIKLRNSNKWLNLSAGLMNDTIATVVATDIFFLFLAFLLFGNIFVLWIFFFLRKKYITEIKQLSEELNHALTTKSRFLANMSHEVFLYPLLFLSFFFHSNRS